MLIVEYVCGAAVSARRHRVEEKNGAYSLRAARVDGPRGMLEVVQAVLAFVVGLRELF